MILGFLRAIEDQYFLVRWSAVDALGNFKDDRASHILPNLLTLIPTKSGEDAFHALTAIQANCKFYNYDIFRSSPASGENGRSEAGHPSQQTTNIYNIDTLNASNSALNLGGTIHGNQSSTQNLESEP